MPIKAFTLVLTSLAMLALTSCLVPKPIKEHRKLVQERVQSNLEISQPRYLLSEDFQLQYRQVGQANKGVALWVHGTPGGWGDSIGLMVNEGFTSNVLLVGIDRPGWGESQYLENPRLVPQFTEQAQLISPLLQKLRREYPDVPLLLVGHSWGGSLVPVIALEYPELIDGIVIAAGGVDPKLTSPRWYNKLGSTWLAQSFIGERMEGANIEVYALQPQLESFEDRWSEVSVPVLGIQGDQDALVHPGNLEFIANQFPDAHTLLLKDQGHLLQAERADLLADCIIVMLDGEREGCVE